MGKKKKNNTPRVKRMNRTARLQHCKNRFPKLEGRNIVRSYRRHFGVDMLCALTELKMLGVSLDPDYEKRLRETFKNAPPKKKKKKKEEPTYESDWGCLYGHDEYHAYIAGFTSAGFSYGVTWEEWEQMESMPEINGTARLEAAVEMTAEDEMERWEDYPPESDEPQPEWDDEIPF